MRFLLLLSFASMGYAMQNSQLPSAINASPDNEQNPLLHVRINQTPIRDAVTHCTDHHCGAMVLCGSCLCAGLFGVACWHAGCVEGMKASRAIAQGVMK